MNNEKVLDIFISADEKLIYAAVPNGISVHDAKDFKRVEFLLLDETPYKLTVSPFNEILAFGTEDAEIFLLNISSGKATKLKEKHKKTPERSDEEGIRWSDKKPRTTSMVFSNDGNYLATASHLPANSDYFSSAESDLPMDILMKSVFSLVVWDVKAKKSLWKLTGHRNQVWGLKFSKDNKLLISWPSDGKGCLWDLENGKLVYVLNHGSQLNQVTFSPDTKMIASTGPFWFTVSDLKTGNVIANVEFPWDKAPSWVIDGLIEKPSKTRQLFDELKERLEKSL